MIALSLKTISLRSTAAPLLLMASLLVGGLLLLPVSAAAVDEAVEPGGNDRSICDTGAADNSAFCRELQTRTGTVTDPLNDAESPIIGTGSIIYRITQFVIFATGALSVVMLVVGGFRYTTSGGDANATKGAKDTIMYAVIGLIIAIVAQVIVAIVLGFL